MSNQYRLVTPLFSDTQDDFGKIAIVNSCKVPLQDVWNWQDWAFARQAVDCTHKTTPVIIPHQSRTQDRGVA